MAPIGRELRAKYAEIIAEGVPERFPEILRKLDAPSNEDSKNESTAPTRRLPSDNGERGQ
jgi:Anti-sigma factor NepR